MFSLASCSEPSKGAAQQVQNTGAEQVSAPSGQLAFRGAQGFGAVSAGGRGGVIIPVTTLADSGRGSLRACIEKKGPRICIFRVSGIIRFTTPPPRIRNPFITIAGQTAPGGGITLAHAGGDVGRTPLVIKDTHDVVIRHLRVRTDRAGDERSAEDAITIERSTRVIIDHVSASWARDELINGFDANDAITVSNSIFAWGIPRHDKCALLASDPRGPQRFSFIGNLCAHSGDRNPDVNFTPGSCVEVFNNVFYNAQTEFAEIWETYGGTPVSLVGNSFIAGPNTRRQAVGIVHQTIGSNGSATAYLRDNRFLGDFVHIDRSMDDIVSAEPSCPFTMAPQSSAAAFEAVLGSAGAFPRDRLDSQVIGEVRNRGGGLASQPGVIPAAAPGPLYSDADGDGMADVWETANGADPHVPDPWLDSDENGIANIEQFLDDLSDRLVAGEVEPNW